MYERVKNEDRQRAPAGTGSFRLAYNGKYQYRVNCIDHLGMQVRKSFTGETKEECIAKKEEFEEKEAMKAKGIDPDATIPDIVKARYKWDLMMNFSNVQGYHRNLETLKIIERGMLDEMPISWDGQEPKYDLRRWDPEEERSGKGLTMTLDELKSLRDIIDTELAEVEG